jgi:hypothetical protein
MALISVMVVILVLTLLGGLVLYLSGQEMHLSTVRYRAAQSLNIAEGGAFAARAALMALVNADPTDATTVDPSLDATTWYANGDPDDQEPFGFLDYLITDGKQLHVNADEGDGWVAFRVNWGLPTDMRKLEFLGKGAMPLPPDPMNLGTTVPNPLGEGSYRAVVLLLKRAERHPSCAGSTPDLPAPCYVHQTGPDQYEIHLEYRVFSDGQVDPQFRRRVTLRGSFSVVVGNTNFAQYALFTDVHRSPAGQRLWFVGGITDYDGPVHTNDEFAFAFFPKFGAPDAQTPCDPARIKSTRLTSASQYAWFSNLGNPVRLDRNENVVGGVRRDAPVRPDCTPGNLLDNPAADFHRGVPAIVVPPNSFNQKGISIGRDPRDTSTVTNSQIRQAIPELPDNGAPVPDGIYIPRPSAGGGPLGGGIFVQGDLRSLTLHADGDLARYEFVHMNGQTVTVIVDRTDKDPAKHRTTVTNSAWITPANPTGTRTFSGVPKGYQGHGHGNSTIVYVAGNIGGDGQGLSGTLEENEQTTIVARGRIDIVGHVRYEDPPNVDNPHDNPLNVLGLFSESNSIRIRSTAPPNLVLHAVMMAGQPGVNDGHKSVVFVEGWNTLPPRGAVHLIGGLIQEYLGAFGTFNPATGNIVHGYGSNFRYDRRMSRGFSPPYFPTTTIPQIHAHGLATVRPQWHEGSPP